MSLKLSAPSVIHLFKSYYYPNTHLPPVDLSDKGVSPHLLELTDKKSAQTAQRLISNPEVQNVLSEPLCYIEADVKPKSDILLKHNFKLLSEKPKLENGAFVGTFPFFTVLEHQDLPGWIIKAGGARVKADELLIAPYNDRNEMVFFAEEESLLRIEMAGRINKIATESGIKVVIPEKKLVAYADAKGATESTKKYCVLSRKIDILSAQETIQAIKDMDADHQREVARKITTLAEKAGIVDVSFDNIRLTPQKDLAIIDTEPAGLLVAKKYSLWNKVFGQRGHSIEKCARIGLFRLEAFTRANVAGGGLEAFHEQAKKDYDKISHPKLSRWKITVSVLSLGVIPVIYVIASYVQRVFAMITLIRLASMENGLQGKLAQVVDDAQRNKLIKDAQKQAVPIIKQLYWLREGVLGTGIPLIV